jgi:hypothetical protein
VMIMLTKERTYYEADRTKIKISNLSKSYIQQGEQARRITRY